MNVEKYAARQKEEETVTIKLSHYNELKTIADGLDSKEHILCKRWSDWRFYTKDETIKQLAEEIEVLDKENDKLRYPHKYVDMKEVRGYSIRKFLKWRSEFAWYQRL